MHPLSTIIDEYQVLRPIAPRTLYGLRHVADLFGHHLGHTPTTDDLTDLLVSGWVQSQEGHIGRRTLASRKAILVSIWRFASHRGYCPLPGQLRRATPGDPMPRAWTQEELHRLLCAALLLPRADWWRAFLLTGYESGLRRTDLIALDRSAIGADGTIIVRMVKTGHLHACQVRPETAALVLALDGPRPLEWPKCRSEFWRYFRRLRKLANVEGGAAQQLRRTGATWVAKENGLQSAIEFLGHRSSRMIVYYIDPRICRPAVWLPPKVA